MQNIRPGGGAGPTLEDCRFNALLIFADSLSDPRFLHQRRALLPCLGAMERLGLDEIFIPARAPDYLNRRTVDAKLAARLRQDHDVPDEAFALVLVGDDGQEKLHSDRPLECQELRGLLTALAESQAGEG
jgi:hypothetical protein